MNGIVDKKPKPYQTLWQFSLESYSQSEVKKSCLNLQDQYGFNVNILLAALWAAAWKQKISLDDFSCFQENLKKFDSTIVIPLRKARRAVVNDFGFEHEKTPEENNQLNEEILSVEIKAEKIYQQQLEHLILSSFEEMNARILSVESQKIDAESFHLIGKENLTQYGRVISVQSVHGVSQKSIALQLERLLNSVVV